MVLVPIVSGNNRKEKDTSLSLTESVSLSLSDKNEATVEMVSANFVGSRSYGCSGVVPKSSPMVPLLDCCSGKKFSLYLFCLQNV